MIEVNVEEWVTKWEQSSGVGGRLTAFVSSAEGEKLIHIFRANRLDPEVVPFLFTLIRLASGEVKEGPIS